LLIVSGEGGGDAPIHWGTSGDDCVGPSESTLLCNHRSLTLADDGDILPSVSGGGAGR
jgi:hypothetical protein